MYDYTIEEESYDPLFYFTTIFDYVFEIRLKKYPTDLRAFENVFSVSVDCLNDKYPKKDTAVGKTVYKILYDFLSKNKRHLLMYVCDLEDEKLI